MRAILAAVALLSRTSRIPLAWILTCMAILPATQAGEPAVALFSGSLSQPAADGDDQILRRFEAITSESPAGTFFCVLDDADVGTPWAVSFGRLDGADPGGSVIPRILYEYNSSEYSIPLPPLKATLPDAAAVGSTWEHGGWHMEITDRRMVGETACWQIDARERRGRRQTILSDMTNGDLIEARADVFMGQGDVFHLTMVRSSRSIPAPEQSARLQELQTQLLRLQGALQLRPDSTQRELSERQVVDVTQAIAQLGELARETALQELVVRILRDTERQSKRVTDAMDRATRIVNSPAPQFSLNLVGGGTLDSASLAGRTVILHFWDYRDQPISEPYGQTGYLDFLYHQRRKMDVLVVGIATHPDFHNEVSLSKAKRSARKLQEFMNLTYPIGFDDGALLRSLGDPRDARGSLPLWIVVTADGKVAHYHAGFYEVDPARGLRELDAVVTDQIRGRQ